MTKDEVLEIYRKECEKRGQVQRKHVTSDGIEYYTSGELNVERLVKTIWNLTNR